MVTLVDLAVKNRWEKEFNKGSNKDYPNIKLVFSELKRVLKSGGKIIADVNSNNSQFALDGKYMGDNIYVNSGRDKNQEEIFCFCPNDEIVFQEIFSQYFNVADIGRSTSILMNNSTDEFIYCGSKD